MAQSGAEPVVVEAPKRIALPPGTFQITSTVPSQWGADVVLVDADGVEIVHKTTERQCAELCEQIVQEAVPVTLELETITRGKNAGKVKLTAVHRWKPPLSVDENAALDAEIAAKEGLPL